jgi:outer membrane lipoprotein-sorting protein
MKWRILFFLLVHSILIHAQDADKLIKEVKAKLNTVKDYQATGKLKTDVAFLKLPISKVQVYYKNPNQFKIKKDGGISLLPKNGMSINLNNLLMQEQFVAVAAGTVTLNSILVKVIKLLPLVENSDLVLTTLYIDDKKLLILKATSTTRDNGSYDMEFQYGKFAQYGLPDKVVFSFQTKDYKLPKGITFEYESGDIAKAAAKSKDKKGKVEITYDQYIINKGLTDQVFR